MGSYLAFWPFGPSFPFILAFWAFISFHFGLLGFHFLSFWPFRPLFPVILAFWACISFHFGLLGLHFLAFWLCGLHFLAFWPFRGRRLGSFDFGLLGLVGLHFLAFWLCGLHFLAFWPFRGRRLGPPTSCQKWPVCPTSLQWIYQRQDRLHFAVFSLLGLYFLAFWPCRPSFPCILALWAFISLHFGLVGLHFLAFWPCGPSFPCILAFWGSASGPPPTSCQKWPVCPTSLQWIYQGRDRLHFAVFSLLGLHFLAFWPCGPLLPCILALWVFISLRFGLLGFHFLSFWLCGPSFPCILAFWALISFHFGLVGLHFLAFWPFRGQLLGPPPKLPKMARLPNVLPMDLAAP